MTHSYSYQIFSRNSVMQYSWECLVNAWNSQIWSAPQLDLLKAVLIENREGEIRDSRAQRVREPQIKQTKLPWVRSRSTEVGIQRVSTGNGPSFSTTAGYHLAFVSSHLDIAKVMVSWLHWYLLVGQRRIEPAVSETVLLKLPPQPTVKHS